VSTISNDCCNFDAFFVLTFADPRRMSAVLANIGFVNERGSHDAIRVRKTRPTIEWLPANRWRTRGSWERSRLSEIDSLLTRTLRATRSGGYFVFRSKARSKIPPAEAGMGDPDPRARAGTRAPKARGLPEGTRHKPDTDGRANQEGFAMAARCSERRDRICFYLVGRMSRLSEHWW